MKNKKLSFCLVLALLMALTGVFSVTISSTQEAQSADAMLGAALHLEEGEGNLDAAIDKYKEFLARYGDNKSLAATAQLHIGICYEKLGLREARMAYETVIERYPQQLEAVKTAKERISRLASVSASAPDQPRFRKIVIPVKLSWQSPTPNGPINGFGACLSPDGKILAFGSEGSIWTIPVPGKVSPNIAGEPRRLTEAIYAYGSGISWSADGKWIGFNAARKDGGEDIYVISPKGGEPENFASRPVMGLASYAYDSLLSLSPDGSVLAFASGESDDSSSLGIKIATSGSKSSISLTDDISVEPAFSPDGRKIAYVSLSREKGPSSKIKVISPEREDSFLIAETSNRSLRSPVWSPDGRMIALLSARGLSAVADELWVAPIPDGEQDMDAVTKFKLPQETWLPLAGWTSDNKIGLVFGSPSDPVHQAIYTVPAMGGKATQVTPSGSFYWPRWSADGKKILFLPDTDYSLGFVPELGGTVTTMSTGSNPAVQEVGPGGRAISPDGTKIVFTGITERNKKPNLWMMPTTGGQPIQITEVNASIGQDRFPCWLPDGSSFLFIRAENWRDGWFASVNIYQKPADGGEARRISSASDAVTWGSLACSPDGKSVAYFSQDAAFSKDDTPAVTNATSIKIKPIDGGTPRIVARVDHSEGNEELCWSPDGKKLAFNAGSKIWTVSVDGGKSVEVETGLDAYLRHISWSPDGQKLAFTGFRYADPELWLMEDFLPLVKR